MGRTLRTTVPTSRQQLILKTPEQSLVRERDKQPKRRQEATFNRRRGVREMPELIPGETVWVPDRNREATVVDKVDHQSYEILETSDGTYHKNSRDMVLLPEQRTREETPNVQTDSSNPLHRSRQDIQPPERYDPSWN